MKVKEKKCSLFVTGQRKPSRKKVKAMTISEIEKACKKLGVTYLPPDDEIYREPASIIFINKPPNSDKADLNLGDQKKRGN